MVSSTVAPTQQESLGLGVSPTSEAEIAKTLLPNSDQDAEMADARGKSILHHSRSSSAEDDGSLNPPKKRISPNRRGKASLLHSSTGTNQLPRSLQSGNAIPRVAPAPTETPANTTMADNHPATQPTHGPAPMVIEHQPLPVRPLPPTPPTEDQPPLQLQQETRRERTPTPPPGVISAAEMAAMRKFASERSQTLAQKAAIKSAPDRDPLKLTPHPEPDGFHVPQGEFSWWVIDNIHPEQINKIGQQKGATLACIVEGENAHDGSHSPTIAAGLAREIRKLFPNEDPQVVPGMAATDPTRYTDPPYAYFVFSLLSDTYVKLISQMAWRNRSIRFCAYTL